MAQTYASSQASCALPIKSGSEHPGSPILRSLAVSTLVAAPSPPGRYLSSPSREAPLSGLWIPNLCSGPSLPLRSLTCMRPPGDLVYTSPGRSAIGVRPVPGISLAYPSLHSSTRSNPLSDPTLPTKIDLPFATEMMHQASFHEPRIQMLARSIRRPEGSASSPSAPPV